MTFPAWLHVFLDVPAESAEVARRFWSAATGWGVGTPWSGHPEDPAGLPFCVSVQNRELAS